MAGIGVEIPTGPDWEHSLDEKTWQASNKFATQPDGKPFVEGIKYTIYSRNVTEEIHVSDSIVFSADDNRDTIDDTAKRGGVKKGWTDQLLRLMGGIVTSLPTTTDADLPQVVIDASGRLLRRGGKIADYIRISGPSSFPKNQTGQYSATVYYTDGSSGPAIGAIYSVQGVDAAINFASGLMTPGPNAEVSTAEQEHPYTVTATYQGLKHSKGVVLTAASLNFVRTGAPKYFESIGLLGPNYDGSLDIVTCFKITGWVADRNHPNERAQARLYINGILATTVTAHVKRTDVTDYLKLTNTSGDVYGFEYTVPAKFRTGQKLVVELRPVSGTNAFRYSPKSSDDACLDLSTLINVAANKTVTANTDAAGPEFAASNLTDERDDTTWITVCVGPDTPVINTIDLNGTAAPQQIKILPRQNDGGVMPISYFVDGSLDGTWFRLATVNNQVSGTDETILPVEKDLNGNYRTLRYVRTTTVKNGSSTDCNRVQAASVRVMAPSLTPLDGPAPTKQPQSLLIQGDSGVKEGTQTYYKVVLFYTDKTQEDVTSQAVVSFNGGSDVAFEKVGNEARLTIAGNNTANDTRSCQLKAYYNGLSAFKDMTIYDATAVFPKSYRIDRIENATTITEGGDAANYRITALMSDGSEQPYTGAGSYSIIEPYPDGMTAVTGANATCVVTLPANSITANLDRVLRFTFPAGGGFIETTLSLINVNDSTVTFMGYDIMGDLTLRESATQAVTGNYQLVKVYSDGSRIDYTGSGSYGIEGQYPDRMSFSTLGAGKGTVTLAPNSITADLTIVLKFFYGDSVIRKTVQLLNVASTQPPGTESCSDYRKASDAEYDTMARVTIYEYLVSGGNPRAFVSRAEAISGMQNISAPGGPGKFVNFDIQRCTSATFEVGARLYGNNAAPDKDYFLWPIEKGWWGAVVYDSASQANQYFIIQTDACGYILTKERYS